MTPIPNGIKGLTVSYSLPEVNHPCTSVSPIYLTKEEEWLLEEYLSQPDFLAFKIDHSRNGFKKFLEDVRMKRIIIVEHCSLCKLAMDMCACCREHIHHCIYFDSTTKPNLDDYDRIPL